MCYLTILTNKQTYGPYGTDADDSTDGLQIPSGCINEKWYVDVPQRSDSNFMPSKPRKN